MIAEIEADAARARRAALVRKAAGLRYSAIAARAAVLELGDERAIITRALQQTDREEHDVRAALQAIRGDHGRPDTEELLAVEEARLALIEERRHVLRDVLDAELRERIEKLDAEAQSYGRSAEQLLAAATGELSALEILHAL